MSLKPHIFDKSTRMNALIGVAGILLLVAKYGPPWSSLSQAGTITLAVMVVMALFWVVEPIPIYATALIPLVVFPLLGVAGFQDVAYSYANKSVYLFFGGFLLAIAMEATGLHRRLALHILRVVGTRPANILAGFIVATGGLSMWISNTASTVMMIPIAFSVLALLKNIDASMQKSMTLAIMLAIPFSATIGGMATLIGTPPNAVFAAFASEVGMDIGFGQFMVLGLPIALGGLALLWFLFAKVLFRLPKQAVAGAREVIDKELRKLSKMERAELMVLIVFKCTAFLWVFRKLLTTYVFSHIGMRLSDPLIAMLGGLSLFFLPNGAGGRIMTWKRAKTLPWGVLLLFGGGLALGKQIQATGVGSWIAYALQGPLARVPLLLIITLIVLVTIVLSQFASNTAITAAFLPIFYPLAQSINIHPLFILLPLTLAASTVFMLPSATPPNAIAMASEQISIREMVKYGGVVNVVFAVFVIAVIYCFLRFNLAFDLGDGSFEFFTRTMMKE